MKRFLSRAVMLALHVGFVRPTLYWFGGLRYHRRDRVPRGPCVVVSNHNSHLDAAVLMSMFPLRRLPHVHPVAAADYFGETWIRRAASMLMMNAISIERRPRVGADPLAPMTEALEAGETLIFFPEGSRGEAGVIAPFRPGIGRLVNKMPGLLIVPVFLSGPERIWPRGQIVPVPLSIDALIGRPRTYPDDAEPGLIAEMLQRDVMALAPPPPPMPQPHTEPPLRVAVCCLDPETRATAFRMICRRLARVARTLGITDPVVEFDTEGERELTGPIPQPRARPWLGALAWMFRTSGMFKGQKFVEMVDLAQIDEALGHRPASRIVVTDGSALVDLVAWAVADFYHGKFDESGTNHLLQYLAGRRPIPTSKWWSFIRHAPEVWLVNTFDLARPPLPDVLAFVSLPLPGVMERLRRRGEPLEPHENEVFLARLQDGYREVGGVLARRNRVTVIEIDASVDPLEVLVERVEQAVRARAADATAVEPQLTEPRTATE
jgi:1-acyl-sn-glycerol-3-phosphate acyltransferase